MHLSDNPGAVQNEEIAVPITTPACSPESNGTSDAFVWTMRRDYLDEADLSCA